MKLSRRNFGKLASALTVLPPLDAFAATPYRLRLGPADVPLVLDKGPRTAVWAFNAQVPGPLLRFRQGERLLVEVENGLQEATTVHWHGLRPPASMDGVPYLSHPPIEPGQRFLYDFDLLDAGTFWYHPHLNSSEQLGRGLHGALIVDEISPPEVDRDVLWVLDDWRLDQEAQIAPFGGNMHDASHAGRIGNAITVNGSIEETFQVFSGERVRLRLVNVANARNFGLRFDRLEPWLIALDGQPTSPRRLPGNRVLLGAGQRADLIIDMTGEPGQRQVVIDDAYGRDYAFEMMQLVYAEEPVGGLAGSGDPAALPANPIAEPDLANAETHSLIFEGGAMGGLKGAMMDGTYRNMRELAQAGKLWAINGAVIGDAYKDPPLLALKQDRSYVLQLENRTAFPHPIHLHGHGFRVISRNGETMDPPPMRDTTLLMPDERQEIAFVADNPGQWMLHCHILEHQETAMMGVVSVS